VTVPLAIGGWIVYLLLGQLLLEWFFRETDGKLFRTSAILLAGTALASAFEPVARMQMGLGRLSRLFYVRATMLVVTLTMLLVLYSLPMLDRFSIATAMGFAAAACGLALTYARERLR
jgi:hypothetical protein